MTTAVQADLHLPQNMKSDYLRFNKFRLDDHQLIRPHVKTFQPLSCEYNFSNLFAWQDAYEICFTMYHGRILIYDKKSKCSFMPLGEDFSPKELACLSLKLKNMGLAPDFSLVTPDYIKKYPDIEKCYIIKEDRDNSEYIYDVESLCELKGTRLHKKRNLISQFKRLYPDFKVHWLKGEYRHKALELTQNLLKKRESPSITLDHELSAMKISFDHFDELELNGIAVTVNSRLAAFSVFSGLSPSTCDIQFEKSDAYFKGASQLINLETAKYLIPKYQYLNREQDLGIPGLRRAKMSYEPLHLLTPYNLIFNQS